MVWSHALAMAGKGHPRAELGVGLLCQFGRS